MRMGKGYVMNKFIKKIEAFDSDEYGLSDAVYFIEIGRDEYLQIKKIRDALQTIAVDAKVEMGENLYVSEIYEKNKKITFENRENIGVVYDSEVESIEADFDGYNINPKFPYKHVSGYLSTNDRIAFEELENFFGVIKPELEKSLVEQAVEHMFKLTFEGEKNDEELEQLFEEHKNHFINGVCNYSSELFTSTLQRK